MSSVEKMGLPKARFAHDLQNRSRPELVFSFLSVAELALVSIVAMGIVATWLGIIAHIALVAASSPVLLRMPPPLLTSSAIGWTATLFTGPFGSIGALALLVWLRSNSALRHGTNLDDWYRRLSPHAEQDPAETIHGNLVDGRAMQRDSIYVPHLPSLIAQGDLATKQAILGYIGLNYHADLRPVLMKALASPDAMVRVQAAAVYAKLREKYKGRFRECLSKIRSGVVDELGGTTSGNALATELHICLSSGFLDPSERRQAGQAAIAAIELASARSLADLEDQLQLYRILEAAGSYDLILERLRLRAGTIDGELRQIYIVALMQLGKSRELADAIGHASVNGHPVLDKRAKISHPATKHAHETAENLDA